MSATTGRVRTPLPLTHVTIADQFWAPRRELIRTKTLRQQHEQMRSNGQFDALKLNWRPGDPNEPHIFWESDIAKWIEAASYCLATADDPDLDRAIDATIDLLAGAQQPDGYLNVYFTVVKPGERFTDLRDAHELYCAGHLIEAGVAHHQATGKTTLLSIVRRYADLIEQTFGPGGACEGGYDGHQEIELALVKLYRATGERRYLELSRRFIDARGQQPFYFEEERRRRDTPGYLEPQFPDRDAQPQRFREYNQSHLPVVDQAEVVGHSVRAMYMYSAMTDLAAEYDDPQLFAAVSRLWDNLSQQKMYITGGIGSDPSIEGFGPPYDLPNADGYAETCASIGLVQWAQRMSNHTGDARYVDTLERALCNGVLSCASADGTRYFYDNPLSGNGDVQRQEWFRVACCPPNFARLLSELGRYVYAQGDDEAVVNLFVGGTARFEFDTTSLVLQQQTAYPQTGSVKIIVSSDQGRTSDEQFDITISIRIPAWATPTVRINGEHLVTQTANGYLKLHRTWSPDDAIGVDLGMTPQRTWAHPSVLAAAGKVALERGPIVFCLEGIDHTEAVSRLSLPRTAAITEQLDDVTGVVTLHADGTAERGQPAGTPLYRTTPPQVGPAKLTAVPYFSWANRGQSDMTVWIRDTAPDPAAPPKDDD